MNKAIAIVLVVMLGGCSRAPTPDTEKAALDVQYTNGFFEPERNNEGSWRWMGPEGTVLLPNTGRPMVLHVEGRLPTAQLKAPPEILVELNGQLLDKWNESGDRIEREYVIAPEQQGSAGHSELRISASTSFVPSEIDPASPDKRRLSMTIRDVAWQPK